MKWSGAVAVFLVSGYMIYSIWHEHYADEKWAYTQWEDTVYFGFPILGVCLVLFAKTISLWTAVYERNKVDARFFSLLGWLLIFGVLFSVFLL